jgi:hypothetical protein
LHNNELCKASFLFKTRIAVGATPCATAEESVAIGVFLAYAV